MPEGLILIIMFVVGIAALVKASDVFTEAAEQLGLALGFPPFIIGVTIISIGTSLPELISSLFALSENVSEVVIGNVVGSNIANIFLVVGTAAIVSKKGIDITYDLVTVDLPLFVGSAFLLTLEVWDGDFTTGEALLLVLAYGMYLLYIANNSQEDGEETRNDDETTEAAEDTHGKGFLFKQLALIALSAAFIYFGANFTIDAVIGLSKLFKVGEEIIAVSAIALGTSLPELIVTLNAARKGKAELAVGNVLGSNIFNTFMVMGVPGLVGHLDIPRTIVTESVPTMIAGTILLFFVAQDKKLTIWEGWLFYIMYIWFIGETFNFL
ncbi:calcium/sodium antiporter [Okeania sp. SIO2G5]|uniref:calcium/sodium antiporter n=1 Tax=Okeania sp. SIO2G5 TaxID=2607796 RepID=UPI0013C0BEAC|nr:calcium/sodium antiporter [Okeania sp. SIO2G5]NEP76439.1 calcium/sodium antiporter [Okeania sp. SIO2G5]